MLLHRQLADVAPLHRGFPARSLALACGWLTLLSLAATVAPVEAWDYEAHRVVNEAALAILPTNFPAFVRTPQATERIAFLSGEPDRWRNTPDNVLKHVNHPDHYIDLEELDDYGLTDEELPVFRYDFIAHLAIVRNDRPGSFPAIDPASNKDHTRQLVGLLPWTLTEHYSRLKSGFSSLRALERHGGTPEEIENERQNIIYVMGVMGHFAGDAGQPLHTTLHFNGWVGDNPNGYTTDRSFHALTDGGFFLRTGLPTTEAVAERAGSATGLPTAGAAGADGVFREVVKFIRAQQGQVEPLYRLEKDGAFTPDADPERARDFLTGQMALGARLLANLWVSAWRDAPEDTWLIRKLSERRQGAEPGR